MTIMDITARDILPLGAQGESGVTAFRFDPAAWRAAYGEGRLCAYHRRARDAAAHPVPLEEDSEGRAIWVVLAAETAEAGEGAWQLFYHVEEGGEQVVKASRLWKTVVSPSLTAVEAAPTAGEDWYQRLYGLAMRATEASGALKGALRDGGRRPLRAAVSFTDDDCRSETYQKLFPLFRAKGITGGLACAPGSLGQAGYMRFGEVREMAEAGFEVMAHSLRQESVKGFATAEALEENIAAVKRLLGAHELTADIYAYPNGLFRDDYLTTVRKHFMAGMGVNKGINHPPYATYYLYRNELFPANGSYTLQNAKADVDRLKSEGGWLIFVTHAWYESFDEAALGELIDYIRAKGIPILPPGGVLERTGNLVEYGLVKKPLENAVEPFLVVDGTGQLYTNALHVVDTAANVPLTLMEGKTIWNDGSVHNTSDPAYVVSEVVPVTAGSRLQITAWAADGYCLYRYVNSAGNKHTWFPSTNSWAQGGNYLTGVEVTVPQYAAGIQLAGNVYKQQPHLRVLADEGEQ